MALPMIDTPRIRSMLFVPADSERKLAKAAGAGADALILDLEDSVLPGRKVLAREMAREYLEHGAQGSNAAAIWVRVNDLASGEILRDLVAVVCPRLAGILLPKIRGPEDVRTVTNYLDALELAGAMAGPVIRILALVTETPLAVLRMGDLAQASLPRLAGLSWGAEDLSSAVGAGDPRLPDGPWRPLYEHARSQCLLAAYALNVVALDTVYVDFRDGPGLARACAQSRHDGFTGRFAIHPDQVPVINEAFTPSAEEVALAQRIIAAFASGAGAVSLDGKMYDVPHLKAAQRLLGGHALRAAAG